MTCPVSKDLQPNISAGKACGPIALLQRLLAETKVKPKSIVCSKRDPLDAHVEHFGMEVRKKTDDNREASVVHSPKKIFNFVGEPKQRRKTTPLSIFSKSGGGPNGDLLGPVALVVRTRCRVGLGCAQPIGNGSRAWAGSRACAEDGSKREKAPSQRSEPDFFA